MTLSKRIAPLLRDIDAKLQRAKRSNLQDNTCAGWGQFLEAEGHKEQIGPYGTCAGVLFKQIISQGEPIDTDVSNQIKKFWTDPAENTKILRQNVRLAFLILSIARVQGECLTAIRNCAIEEIKSRQRTNGSWGDWSSTQNGTEPPPRQETTAWVLLALHRAGHCEAETERAQTYLNGFVTPDGAGPGISNFAAAVLIHTLPFHTASRGLRIKARSFLSTHENIESEEISFFDYTEQNIQTGSSSFRRDYLCYPLILTYSLMVSGLTQNSNRWISISNIFLRISLADKLLKIYDGGMYFKLPGAAFAATVDQSAIALSFEHLLSSEKILDSKLSGIKPVVKLIYDNMFVRVFIPLTISVIALVAIQDPKLLILPVRNIEWLNEEPILSFISKNSDLIRLISGLFLFLANSLPGRLLKTIKGRFGA
jgi:hypothetical protein